MAEILHLHFVLCKPYGYISQFIHKGKRKKKVLGDLYDFPNGTMAIGRLDEASEGMLLLTTDGKLSEEIRSAKYEKEYLVQVDGLITDEALEQLKKGVVITVEGQAYMTKESSVKRISEPTELPVRSRGIRGDHHGPTSWVSITIREGKFRQVRKMTAVVGFPTLRLLRCRIGELRMDSFTAGEVKSFSPIEL